MNVSESKLPDYGPNLMEGFNNLNLEKEDILKVLENAEQFFKGKYLTGIGKTEWDSLNWSESSIAEKKNIINSVDIVFTASESVDKFNDSKNKLVESKVNSLLLDCSDSHNNCNSSDKDRIGNCFTWIKADPTFEGLKQILYEPDERIKIQPNKPDEKGGYQVIDSVLLEKDGFWKETIYLNENLNTIIGGRSTRKSILLKSIAKKIDKNAEIDDEKDFIQKHLSEVIVKWKDAKETENRNIDFFPQSYIHEITKDREKRDKLIENIIGDKEENKFLTDYETENSELKKLLSKSILEVFQLQTKIEKLQVQLKEKGDKKGVETEIKRLGAKNQELSKNPEISLQSLDSYQNSLKKIAENEQLIKECESDLSLLSALRNKSIIDTCYISSFDNLSVSTKDCITEFFNKYKNEWVKYVESINKDIHSQKKTYETQIETTKSSEIFKKCTQYYNNNKELNDIQTKLKEENSKLQEIKGLEEKLNQLNSRKTEVITKIIKDHNSYYLHAKSLVKKLKIEYEGIEITPDIEP